MRYPSLTLICVLLAGTLLNTACGWQLRGAQADQAPVPGVAIISDDSYSQLARTIREVWLQQAGDAQGTPEYTLRILREDIDRRPVTFTANGTPAQYEMTLQVTYTVQEHGQAQPSTARTMATHRIFDFDPRNVVAKSEEERELLQHMRQQLAQRLLSEISRIEAGSYTPAGPEQAEAEATGGERPTVDRVDVE